MEMHELMMQIERVESAMMHNVEEARERIEHAHKIKDVCRMEADWYKEMAATHLSFNGPGKTLYDKLMRDMMDHPEAAHYLMGAKPIYERWMYEINKSAAEVQAMISMYSK